MEAVIGAPTVELSIAEEEQRIREILIEEGSDAVATGQNINWRIGRAAVKYAQTFAPAADEKQRKQCLREYALSINMIDNTSRIHEFYAVAAFFPEDTQAHFKDVTWSRFRECQRHCRDLHHASTILHQYGDAPVAKVREAILGKPSPRHVSAAFTVHWVASWSSDGPRVIMDGLEQERLRQFLAKHPNHTVELVVTYTEEATA